MSVCLQRHAGEARGELSPDEAEALSTKGGSEALYKGVDGRIHAKEPEGTDGLQDTNTTASGREGNGPSNLDMDKIVMEGR